MCTCADIDRYCHIICLWLSLPIHRFSCINFDLSSEPVKVVWRSCFQEPCRSRRVKLKRCVMNVWSFATFGASTNKRRWLALYSDLYTFHTDSTVCIHTYIHTHIHTCIHTYTHTYIAYGATHSHLATWIPSIHWRNYSAVAP